MGILRQAARRPSGRMRVAPCLAIMSLIAMGCADTTTDERDAEVPEVSLLSELEIALGHTKASTKTRRAAPSIVVASSRAPVDALFRNFVQSKIESEAPAESTVQESLAVQGSTENAQHNAKQLQKEVRHMTEKVSLEHHKEDKTRGHSVSGNSDLPSENVAWQVEGGLADAVEKPMRPVQLVTENKKTVKKKCIYPVPKDAKCESWCATDILTRGTEGCRYNECIGCSVCCTECYDRFEDQCPQWVHDYGCKTLLLIGDQPGRLNDHCKMSCGSCRK